MLVFLQKILDSERRGMNLERLVVAAVGLVVLALALMVPVVMDHQNRLYDKNGQRKTIVAKVGFWYQKAYQLAIVCIFSALIVMAIAVAKKYLF